MYSCLKYFLIEGILQTWAIPPLCGLSIPILIDKAVGWISEKVQRQIVFLSLR